MARAGSPLLVLLLGGAVCIGAGVAIGKCWGDGDGDRERLWRDDARPAPAAGGGLPSFRHVVQAVGPAVVTVRARVPQSPPSGDGAGQASEPVAEPFVDAPAEPAADLGPAPGVRPGDAAADGAHATGGPVFAESGRRPAAARSGGRRDGSGFVVHPRGLVVTSRHVVVGANAIEVNVPQHGWLRADLVGEDRATDLALLRLVAPPAGLPSLPLGDGADLAAGDWIVTVGDPFGLARTVTAGVVSFVGRHLPHSDLAVTNDFLQISAPVNPGNSGCPVFDVHGRVVGVTTQVAVAAQGISFAVPVQSVKWALDAMRRRPDGHVRRGYLGIEFSSRPGFDERGQPQVGAIITGVAPGAPGERAGLRRGDIVLRIDDVPVTDAKQLHARIVCGDPGTQLALLLLRDGQIHDPIVAELGEMGASPGVPQPN